MARLSSLLLRNKTNGFVYVDFHSAFADEKLGLPKSFSDDGCHPNPESYFPMEEMVLEAIENTLK